MSLNDTGHLEILLLIKVHHAHSKYMYNHCLKILKLYVNKYVKVSGGFELMTSVKIISLILHLLKAIYF